MLMIHDCRLPDVYVNAIKNNYPECKIFTFSEKCFKSKNSVYESIRFHPDIFFFQLDKMLVYSPNLDVRVLKGIADLGVTLVKGETEPTGHYPYTCCYNALKVGKYLFHNIKYTDPVIIKMCKEQGYEPIDVKQGYAGCSSMVVNEKAIITADPGIKTAAQTKNIDVLFISTGEITLFGQKYGFLGGASGILPDGSIMVAGQLSRHKDHMIIERFLRKHKADIIELADLDIYDSGGYLFF